MEKVVLMVRGDKMLVFDNVVNWDTKNVLKT